MQFHVNHILVGGAFKTHMLFVLLCFFLWGGGSQQRSNLTSLRISNEPGTLSMANTGAPNSGGSQFFMNVVPPAAMIVDGVASWGKSRLEDLEIFYMQKFQSNCQQ